MKFAKSKSIHLPGSKLAFVLSMMLALFFVLSSVGILFAFEKYPALIESYGVDWLGNLSVLVASLIVICSVFAIPSLLHMSVSPLMRWLSMLCGWVVVLYWLSISLWQINAGIGLSNIGLFGAQVQSPQDWSLVGLIIAVALAMIYVNIARRTAKPVN